MIQNSSSTNTNFVTGTDIIFASELLLAIECLELSQPTTLKNAVKLNALSRFLMDGLGVTVDESRQAIDDYLVAGDLRYTGSFKGSKLITSRSIEVQTNDVDVPNPPESAEAKKSKTEFGFSEEELNIAEHILQVLGTEKLAERGVKAKRFWLDNAESEQEIRRVINKLANPRISLIERYTPKLTRTSNSRKNSEMFVRFIDIDTLRLFKRDPTCVLDTLKRFLIER